MEQGWIKLHRKFLNWEWYDEPKVSRLFVHCLLKANHKEKEWRGNKIPRGTFITSLNSLSNETGLSIQNIRTSLDKLQSTGEVNKESTSLSTWLTVVNYDDYQASNKEVTSNQQASNKDLTTTKNDNNDKNVKKYTIPRVEDVEKYFRSCGDMILDDIELEAKKFINHYSEKDWQNSSGKKIKYWKKQASTWNANYQQWNRDRLNSNSGSNGESKNLEVFGL